MQRESRKGGGRSTLALFNILNVTNYLDMIVIKGTPEWKESGNIVNEMMIYCKMSR